MRQWLSSRRFLSAESLISRRFIAILEKASISQGDGALAFPVLAARSVTDEAGRPLNGFGSGEGAGAALAMEGPGADRSRGLTNGGSDVPLLFAPDLGKGAVT